MIYRVLDLRRHYIDKYHGMGGGIPSVYLLRRRHCFSAWIIMSSVGGLMIDGEKWDWFRLKRSGKKYIAQSTDHYITFCCSTDFRNKVEAEKLFLELKKIA